MSMFSESNSISCGKYSIIVSLGFCIVPELGSSIPAIILSRVDFPEPLEPINPILSSELM